MSESMTGRSGYEFLYEIVSMEFPAKGAKPADYGSKWRQRLQIQTRSELSTITCGCVANKCANRHIYAGSNAETCAVTFEGILEWMYVCCVYFYYCMYDKFMLHVNLR